jgi:trans-aconitate 2-methyltransferase
MTESWNPDQYERFKAERTAPFRDLLALVRPVVGGRVVDLGCGTGELTDELHLATRSAYTLGLDSSAAMLAKARPSPRLEFREGDIATFTADAPFDIVFSNAALQWVPRHRELLARLAALVAPGGQLAVQMPTNSDHPSHLVATDVAGEEPFASAFAAGPPADPVRTNVLRPEQYAELLDELGFVEQHVRLQVYGHHLDSTADVVEWVKGTTLTRFRERLPGELYETFVERYGEALISVLGDRRPYFYAFKRILFWGRKPT